MKSFDQRKHKKTLKQKMLIFVMEMLKIMDKFFFDFGIRYQKKFSSTEPTKAIFKN